MTVDAHQIFGQRQLNVSAVSKCHNSGLGDFVAEFPRPEEFGIVVAPSAFCVSIEPMYEDQTSLPVSMKSIENSLELGFLLQKMVRWLM